jgi:hypothetical protein
MVVFPSGKPPVLMPSVAVPPTSGDRDPKEASITVDTAAAALEAAPESLPCRGAMMSALSAPPWKVLIGTDGTSEMGRWGIFFCIIINGSQVSRDEVGELNIPGGVGSSCTTAGGAAMDDCLANAPIVGIAAASGAVAVDAAVTADAATEEEADAAGGAALFQEPLLLLEELEGVVFLDAGEGSRMTPL